jgi:hypothetical protein
MDAIGYTGGIMALYSWFSENKNKPTKKRIRTNSNLIKTPESTKYIANYTMWPTAKIKKGILIKLPIQNDIKDNSTTESSEPLLVVKTPLIVNE